MTATKIVTLIAALLLFALFFRSNRRKFRAHGAAGSFLNPATGATADAPAARQFRVSLSNDMQIHQRGLYVLDISDAVLKIPPHGREDPRGFLPSWRFQPSDIRSLDLYAMGRTTWRPRATEAVRIRYRDPAGFHDLLVAAPEMDELRQAVQRFYRPGG